MKLAHEVYHMKIVSISKLNHYYAIIYKKNNKEILDGLFQIEEYTHMLNQYGYTK